MTRKPPGPPPGLGELPTKVLLPTVTSSKVAILRAGKIIDPAASKALEKLRNDPKSGEMSLKAHPGLFQNTLTGPGRQWGGRRWRSLEFSACPALPAAPGRPLTPIPSTSSPWGPSCGRDENWGNSPRYILPHSTEGTLQEAGVTRHQAGTMGAWCPGILPCQHTAHGRQAAADIWVEDLGGFGAGLGHVQVTQEGSTSGHQGRHRQSPRFLCQVSSPAAAPKPRCFGFQPSQS